MIRHIYLLHSDQGVHLIVSNIKAMYEALQDIQSDIMVGQLKSYSWYCFYLDNNQDVAVPKMAGGHYTVSRRPVLSKYVGHLKPDTCSIPSFKENAKRVPNPKKSDKS